MKPRTKWLAFTLCGAALTGGLYAARWAGFRGNVSPSAPMGIWATFEDHKPPAYGSYVLVCLPGEWATFAVERGYIADGGDCPDRRESLLKSVIAIPGDVVRVSTGGISVNGREVPTSKPLESDAGGRPLTSVPPGDYAVYPGQVWVVGPNDPRSFDSRYWGPISVGNILRTARPWITFGGKNA